MKKFHRIKIALTNFVVRHKYPSMFVGVVLIWWGSSFVLYLIETMAGSSAEPYGSYGSTLWAIIVYLTSGLEVDPPGSVAGKAFAIGILVVGMIVVGGITACITSDLVKKIMKGAQVPEKPRHLTLSGHIVIFGHSPATDHLIREIRHPDVGLNSPIVIVSDEDERIPAGDPDRYREVYCVYGNFTDDEVLELVDIQSADTAIILSHGGDEKSILTCLGVESTAPPVHTIIQLESEENERHIRRTSGDEIIRMDSLALLANATVSHGVTDVLSELLTAQARKNELYFVPVPNRFVGRSFSDLATDLLSEGMLLTGIKSPGPSGEEDLVTGEAAEVAPDIHVNPVPDYTVREEDQLAVIAEEPPNLT